MAKKECEYPSYLGIKYDSYRNWYYIIVTKPIPFEKEDGIRNFAWEKSWSLLILDAEFKQISEINMPDNLSKYELMVIPQGIAIMDMEKSTNNESVFVIYKVL